MPYYCTVPRCTSMAGKAKNVSFHQFPRDEELARLWNDILKRGKPYTKYSKVCSLHFKPEDYTITSVGKNKGQWRTLRKDAVPSQNLPSETPAPYTRKQWSEWTRNTASPNVLDPTIHQQMAQAIYMQTMLAMHAAAPADPLNGPPIIPELPTTQTSSETDTHNNKHTDEHTSYKCTECTKCFKDPDVFLLHKRTHTKDRSVEKENFNMNVTLRSNPILANLLKTNNGTSFDQNWVTMESLLMTALAANMDYIRNVSMIKDDCDRGVLSNPRGDANNLTGYLSNSNGDVNNLSNSRGGTNAVDNFSLVRDFRNSTNDSNDGDDNIKDDLNSDNSPDGEVTRTNQPVKVDLSHRKDQENIIANTSKVISCNDETKITYSGKYYRERYISTDKDYDDDGDNDNNDDNDYHDVSNCDNDLNESMDSNRLVIDESV